MVGQRRENKGMWKKRNILMRRLSNRFLNLFIANSVFGNIPNKK